MTYQSVKHISDRIGVMHNGKLLEVGSSDEIYHYGVHPYTESLLSAIPLPDPDHERERKRINTSANQQMTSLVPWKKSQRGILFMLRRKKRHSIRKNWHKKKGRPV